jgi:hypothetical protein
MAKQPYVDTLVVQAGSNAGDIVAEGSTHAHMLPDRRRVTQAAAIAGKALP